MRATAQLLVIALIACCSIRTVKCGAIQMTLSCENNPDINPVQSQTGCNVTLLKVAEDLRSEIAQLKDSLHQLNQPLVGRSFCNSGKSCRHIKMAKPQADDGEYWVDIDQPRKVYCDMTTDGGGWMLVSNIVSETTQGQAWSLANDLEKISEYSSNSLGLSTSALASLRNHIHFDQLRFFCHKKIPGRTVDIATKNNAVGETVVRYFTGRTGPFPTACGSYDKMADDNSLLSQHCSEWGRDGGVYKVNKWGHDSIPKSDRLFNHPAFAYAKSHWIVPFTKEGRWECDDYKGTVSIGDTWKIFVR